MKSIIKVTAIVALVAIALIAGFWLGKTGSTPLADPSSEVSSPERKVLYYRNPMGLPDISPVPKKDPMGMDYVPVYAGEEPSASNSAVRISPEKIQKLGVKTEAVALRESCPHGEGGLHRTTGRAQPVYGRAKIRGLDPAALRQHHGSSRKKRRPADGCVQSGAGDRAA